jgi:hypothetical protein
MYTRRCAWIGIPLMLEPGQITARLPNVAASAVLDSVNVARWSPEYRGILESGALPGPGWLNPFFAPLDAALLNSLTDPSTNRYGNEQETSPAARSILEFIPPRVRSVARQREYSMRRSGRLRDVARLIAVLTGESMQQTRREWRLPISHAAPARICHIPAAAGAEYSG